SRHSRTTSPSPRSGGCSGSWSDSRRRCAVFRGGVQSGHMRSVLLGLGAGGVMAFATLTASAIAAAPPTAHDVTAARSVLNALTRFDQAALARQGTAAAAGRA